MQSYLEDEQNLELISQGAASHPTDMSAYTEAWQHHWESIAGGSSGQTEFYEPAGQEAKPTVE